MTIIIHTPHHTTKPNPIPLLIQAVKSIPRTTSLFSHLSDLQLFVFQSVRAFSFSHENARTMINPDNIDDINNDCFHDSYDRLLSSTTCSSSSSPSPSPSNYYYSSENDDDVDDDVMLINPNNCIRVRDYNIIGRLLPVPRFPIGVINTYDVWMSRPSSVDERRLRLLRQLGLVRDVDENCIVNSNSDSNSNSNSNSNSVELSLDVGYEGVCLIKNLDNGKEFVVDEVREDGMWGKVKEVGTGRRLTMEEFETSVGRSPIVQELMRRESVEGGNEDMNDTNADGNRSKLKKKGGWLRNIKNVANSVAGYKERRSSEERDTCSEKGGRRLSSATDDSQDVLFNSPEKVRVRQYGKCWKDLTGLYRRQEIQAHNGSIRTMKFSFDGKYLASAGEDCVIHVWQVVLSDRKTDVLFDKQEDGNLSLLMLANGSPEIGLDGQTEKKRRGRLSMSRKSASFDHIVVPETLFGLSEKPFCSFEGHLDDVLDLSWSKSQHLLSSSMDKTVRLWQLSSKSCLKIFSHNDYVTCIQFNPVDDRYFISGSLDAKVRLWSIPDHQVVDWNDMREMVTAACYTPDGQGVLVGSYKGSCYLYDTADNKLQQKSEIDLQNKKKKTRHKRITGFQFVPGTSEVLITSADSRVRVVDGDDLIHKFKGFHNTNRQISASVTSNGKYVVCASEDSQVYVWKHEGDSRASRNRSVTVTHSYEYFHCQDVSVAIPWPGKTDTCWGSQDGLSREPDRLSEDHYEDVPAVNHPPTPEDQINSSPFHGIISSAGNSYFFDRFSSTWPEEKLVLTKKNPSQNTSADFTNGSGPSKLGWGMVIVTAGLRGEIRTFQNFGLPVRL